MRINGDGAGRVADEAERIGALAIQISSNEVFAGAPGVAYGEDDEPGPINPYGVSKLLGERAVADAATRYLLVRTAWVHSPTRGFPARIAAAAEHARSSGEPLRIVDDEWGNPTPVASLIVRWSKPSDCRTTRGPTRCILPANLRRAAGPGPSMSLVQRPRACGSLPSTNPTIRERRPCHPTLSWTPSAQGSWESP